MEQLTVHISALLHTTDMSASALLAMNFHLTTKLAKVDPRYFSDN